MLKVQTFVFNPFQENTSVVWDDSGECVIIDPGCFNHTEEQELAQFIESNGLKPVRLLNTHCHLDHVYGNAFVAQKYGLGLEFHKLEIPILESGPMAAMAYGLPAPAPSPEPASFIEPNSTIAFGNTVFEVLFVPGHCPGHVAFYNAAAQLVIAGDVLFRESIGRTDLPGGDHTTLERSIKEVMYQLPDAIVVYPGHGPTTTIEHEKLHNAFVRA